MDKLIAYIQNGEGRGIRPFFLFSIVLVLWLGFLVYLSIPILKDNPAMVAFAHKFPDISIVNGRVVSPSQIYISEIVPQTEYISMILDTTTDTVHDIQAPAAIYMTVSQLYIKFLDQLQILPLDLFEDMVITPDDILEGMQLSIIAVSVMLILFTYLTVWLGYLFLYFLSVLLCWTLGMSVPHAKIGRVSAIMWISILILDLILWSFGYGFHVGAALIFALVLVLFTLIRLRPLSDEGQISGELLTQNDVQNLTRQDNALPSDKPLTHALKSSPKIEKQNVLDKKKKSKKAVKSKKR